MSTNIEKLKPCPFCGETDVRVESEDERGGHGDAPGKVYVKCQSCKAQGAMKYWSGDVEFITKRIEAFKLWNQRVGENT